MRLTAVLPLLAYAALSLAATEREDAAPCGFKIAPCRSGYTCVADDPACPPKRGENCAGRCLKAKPTLTTAPTKTPKTTLVTKTTKAPRPTYPSCGGFRIEQVSCPKGSVCVDNPHVEGCGMACDRPGICVDASKAEFCGGIAGFRCSEGKMCIDDPRDDCDVEHGGADCGGICV